MFAFNWKFQWSWREKEYYCESSSEVNRYGHWMKILARNLLTVYETYNSCNKIHMSTDSTPALAKYVGRMNWWQVFFKFQIEIICFEQRNLRMAVYSYHIQLKTPLEFLQFQTIKFDEITVDHKKKTFKYLIHTYFLFY